MTVIIERYKKWLITILFAYQTERLDCGPEWPQIKRVSDAFSDQLNVGSYSIDFMTTFSRNKKPEGSHMNCDETIR
jgi:hypothetical protein